MEGSMFVLLETAMNKDSQPRFSRCNKHMARRGRIRPPSPFRSKLGINRFNIHIGFSRCNKHMARRGRIRHPSPFRSKLGINRFNIHICSRSAHGHSRNMYP